MFFVVVSLTVFHHVVSQEWTFPEDFKLGVATSAYQIEGGWDADGKGVSIWDTFTHDHPELIKDGSNGDIACDSYNKWEEDVILLKDLGVDCYRLSLAWTRIFPDGYGTTMNQAGVDYYNNVINRLLESGIEPIVTLFHWDTPQVFSVLGGWAHPGLIDYFVHFSRTAFELFGDRVKTWITINEPRIICYNHKGLVGHVTNDYPIGTIEYLCSHNLLKAHAEVYHIYDKEFRHQQNGKISITLDFPWHEPENATDCDDKDAAELFRQFQFGLYANPILKIDYPKSVKHRVAQRSRQEGFTQSRLPKFTFAEKLRIRGTYDYLGINHYATYYAKANGYPIGSPSMVNDIGGDEYFDPSWEATSTSTFKVVPWGMRHMLKWIKETYGNPDIYITENGYSDTDDTLEDDGRVNYYKKYLNATLQAIHEDGVNVKMYLGWSFMDNFEWKRGYTMKYGLYHVNFADPTRARTPRKSAQYFQNVTRTRIVD